MPLLSSIINLVLHCLIALSLNIIAVWLGLISHGEVVAVYFIVYSLYLYDAQIKFAEFYRSNPDLVEQILREQLSEDEE